MYTSNSLGFNHGQENKVYEIWLPTEKEDIKFTDDLSLYVRAIWQKYIYYNQHYAHDWSG